MDVKQKVKSNDTFVYVVHVFRSREYDGKVFILCSNWLWSIECVYSLG